MWVFFKLQCGCNVRSAKHAKYLSRNTILTRNHTVNMKMVKGIIIASMMTNHIGEEVVVAAVMDRCTRSSADQEVVVKIALMNHTAGVDTSKSTGVVDAEIIAVEEEVSVAPAHSSGTTKRCTSERMSDLISIPFLNYPGFMTQREFQIWGMFFRIY